MTAKGNKESRPCGEGRPTTCRDKYYTTARLLYRLHKITADQVWAYTESDPPKITEDEALAICGPRAKDETAGS